MTMIIPDDDRTYSWMYDADGKWTTTSNWSVSGNNISYPNFSNAQVEFGSSVSQITTRTITLDNNATVGKLTYINGWANQSMTVNGNGILAFDTPDVNGVTQLQTTSVLLSGGANGRTFTNPIIFNKTIIINNDLSGANSGGNLTFSGQVSGPGNIIKTGSATCIFSNDSNSFSGGIKIVNGQLRVTAPFISGYSGGPITLGDVNYPYMGRSANNSQMIAISGNNITVNNIINATGAGFSEGGNNRYQILFIGNNIVHTGDINYSSLGAIQSIPVAAGGSGYVNGQVGIVISGGGGSGATAIPVVSSGTIIQVNVTNPGSGYTSVPTINITANAGSGASLTAVQSRRIDIGNATSNTTTTLAGRISAYGIQGTFGINTGGVGGTSKIIFTNPNNDFGTCLFAQGTLVISQNVCAAGPSILGNSSISLGDGSNISAPVIVELSGNVSCNKFIGFTANPVSSTTRLVVSNPNTSAALGGGGSLAKHCLFDVPPQSQLEITGVLTGTFGITANNSGILKFSGLNTYTGPTTISGGTLIINNNSASEYTMGGNLTSTQLSGSSNFIKTGTGSLAIPGQKSYAGKYIINNGTLRCGGTLNTLGLPTTPISGGWLIFDGGTVEISANTTTDVNRSIYVSPNGGTIRQFPNGTSSLTIASTNTLSGGLGSNLRLRSTNITNSCAINANIFNAFKSNFILGDGSTSTGRLNITITTGPTNISGAMISDTTTTGNPILRFLGTTANSVYNLSGPWINRRSLTQQGNIWMLSDGGTSTPFTQTASINMYGNISGSDTVANSNNAFMISNSINGNYDYYPALNPITGYFNIYGSICDAVSGGTTNLVIGENGGSPYNYIKFLSDNSYSGGGAWSFGFLPGTMLGGNGFIWAASTSNKPFGNSAITMTRSTGNQSSFRNGIILEGSKTINNPISINAIPNTVQNNIISQYNGNTSIIPAITASNTASSNLYSVTSITFAVSGKNDSLTVPTVWRSSGNLASIIIEKHGQGTLNFLSGTNLSASSTALPRTAIVVADGNLNVYNPRAVGDAPIYVSYPRNIVDNTVKVCQTQVFSTNPSGATVGGISGLGVLNGVNTNAQLRFTDNQPSTSFTPGTKMLIMWQGSINGSISGSTSPILNGLYQVSTTGSGIANMGRIRSTANFGDVISVTGGTLCAGKSFYNPLPWPTVVNVSSQYWLLEDSNAANRNPVFGIPSGITLQNNNGITVYDRGTINISGNLQGNLTFDISGSQTFNIDGDAPTTIGITGNVVLTSGTILNIDTTGSTVDVVNINGNLTLDGTVNLPDVSLNVGTHPFITYTGAITDNGIVLGSNNTGRTIAFNTNTGAKQIEIIAT